MEHGSTIRFRNHSAVVGKYFAAWVTTRALVRVSSLSFQAD